MKKIILTLFIAVSTLLSTACTTSSGPYGPGYTTYTSYIDHDDLENDAAFYGGYRNGYDPSNIYWQNYRGIQGNWGRYGSYATYGDMGHFRGGRR